jgi:hypothetical protein
MLEKIGYESILYSDKYIIGKKVINYLPVNEDGILILPNNELILNANWY